MKISHFFCTIFILILSADFSLASNTAAPQFSESSGTFTGSLSVLLSTEENATIHYTVNGHIPTKSSTLYDGTPIPVTGTVMIRARAFEDGKEPSDVVTHVFSELHQSVADFDSDIPLVIVHQFNNPMQEWGEYRTIVYFSVIDVQDNGRAPLLTQELHIHSLSESNYRGTSSLGFPKKQFGIRLFDDDGENRNESILGMPSENNWIMSAPWDDRTLIRNAVAFQLSNDMGRYAPRTRFVELFLHEGSGPVTEDHYHGVYMLSERIKWDNNRVNIQKLERTHNSEPEISGGYIINYEHGREWHIRSRDRHTQFALVRPQMEDITQQQISWIQNYLGDLENALFGNQFTHPQNGYAAWLDPDSFIDYHLITELFKEMDGFRLSTFLHKDRGGRIKIGPIWDYNLSLGNHNPDEGWGGDSPYGWYHENLNDAMYLNGWYSRLFQDPAFVQEYQERWWQLRQGAFTADHIVGMINQYVEKLDEATQRNFDRWDIIGADVWHYSRAGLPSYEDEIAFIIDFVEDRLQWMDAQMGDPPDTPVPGNLRYFWYFSEEIPNDTPLTNLEAVFSISGNARIRFQSALEGYPFENSHPDWRKASMERRNRPTPINYLPTGNSGLPFNNSTMRGLQVKQPFQTQDRENMLIFDIPTTGLNGLLFRFAAMDEGAADYLIIDYTTEAEDTGWTHSGLDEYQLPLQDTYQLYEVNFSDIPDVQDNPDFKVRIRFEGDDLTEDNGNRVTFNNISVESGEGLYTSSQNEEPLAESFHLYQNYPNPFNPSTVINYQLPVNSKVRLEVFDILGRRVAVLVNEQVTAGSHNIHFDATNLASGVYIAVLQAGNFRLAQRMTLIK